MKSIKALSIITIVLGILLFMIGYLFKLLHWPDLFKGLYSGPVFLLIGFILLIYTVFKTK